MGHTRSTMARVDDARASLDWERWAAAWRAGYSRTPRRSRVQPDPGAYPALGATRRQGAATAQQLAAGVDIVFSSVANDAALEQVMFRTGRCAGGTRAGSIVIELSTVKPTHLAPPARSGSQQRRLRADAPSPAARCQAEQGQLVIFVGGEETCTRSASRSWPSWAADVLSGPAAPARR